MKKSIVFIIMLLVILLVASIVFIGFLIFNMNKVATEVSNVENVVSVAQTEKVESENVVQMSNVNKYGVQKPNEDIIVYSYIDQCKYLQKGSVNNTSLSFSLRIPQFNINTEEAQKINKEILAKFNNILKSFDANTSGIDGYTDVKYICDYDYSRSFSKNRIYIYGLNSISNTNASGKKERYTYIYDIDLKKQLSLVDIFSEYNITKEKIIDKVMNNKDFKENYDMQDATNKAILKTELEEDVNDNFKGVNLKLVDIDMYKVISIYVTIGIDEYFVEFSI